MANILTPLAASLLPLSLAWSVAATAGGDLPGAPDDLDAEAPACEIRIEKQGAGVVLEALVYAPAPMSGSYRMRISQQGAAGSSVITQSGAFEAASGSATSLGMVSLGGRGYAATLTVHWDNDLPDCSAKAPSAKPRRAPLNLKTPI